MDLRVASPCRRAIQPSTRARPGSRGRARRRQRCSAARTSRGSRSRAPGVRWRQRDRSKGSASTTGSRGSGSRPSQSERALRNRTSPRRAGGSSTTPPALRRAVPSSCGAPPGVVIGLLAADRIDHGRRWQPGAIRHGAALVAQGERRTWGWSWPLFDMQEPALCGLAHGAAGIAWALGELRASAGEALSADEDQALAAGVEGALRFERSWFDYRRNTWPDLRSGLVEQGAPTPHPSLWCHGSVGIGLTRLRLYQLSRDTALLAEAAAALQSSVDAVGSAGSPATTSFGLTLCHGLGGTLSLLLAAGDVLGEDEHRVTARWLFEQATAGLGADVDQWPSGRGGLRMGPRVDDRARGLDARVAAYGASRSGRQRDAPRGRRRRLIRTAASPRAYLADSARTATTSSGGSLTRKSAPSVREPGRQLLHRVGAGVDHAARVVDARHGAEPRAEPLRSCSAGALDRDACLVLACLGRDRRGRRGPPPRRRTGRAA